MVGSYSEQHQAALQKRGGVILRVVWGEVNFTGVNHQIRGFACSLALVHVQIQGSLTKSSAIYTDRLAESINFHRKSFQNDRFVRGFRQF